MAAEAMEREAKLRAIALDLGAYRAEWVNVSDIHPDRSFRTLCESNACGAFGKCWMCPPDVGDIDSLMAVLATYDRALVFQSVGMLEDSFDMEGMGEAADAHAARTLQIREACRDLLPPDFLCLAAGGCHGCPICAKAEGNPCRFPHRALASLEAYGVNVSQLAKTAGMRYINGQNTVTYFSAIFCR